MELRIRRVYEPAGDDDGFRVLVDRIWPRGMTRERARVDLWLKQAAPSHALRKWYGHDPAKWDEFKRRYFAELEPKRREIVERLESAGGPVTLLYSARDEERNQAVALREYLSRGGGP
ncbi:MAG TPA: DUF488 family protein [Thermoanaerobaculia bacterium]|jgi:uncharacterized protein YeaO (DUF488 family)